MYYRLYKGGVYSSTVSSVQSTDGPGATSWVYQFSGLLDPNYDPYDGTITINGSGSCQTVSQLTTKLTSSRPPGDYPVGYRMRVASYDKALRGTLCSYFWFKAQ